MNEIEDVFVEENPINVNWGQFDVCGDNIKIGEIFQLKDGSQSLSCIRCFQQFQYFTEFSLHIEDHYLNGDIPKPNVIIKTEVDHEDNGFENIEENMVQSEPNICNMHEKSNENNDDEDDDFDNSGQYVDVLLYWSDDEKNASQGPSAESAGQDSWPKCPLCLKSFANIAYVRKHINRIHKQKIYAAQIKEVQKQLNENSVSIDQMAKDSIAERKVKLEKPSIDSKTQPILLNGTPEELILGVHYVKVQEMHKCLTCKRVIKKFYDFKEHHRIHTGTKNVFCPLCVRPFLTVKYVRKHIKRYHKQRISIDIIREFQKKLRQGIQIEEPEQYWIGADSQQGIQPVENQPKEKQKFECFVCHRQMALLKSLKTHFKLHDVVKYFCPLPKCNQSLSSKRYVREHLVRKHDFVRSEIGAELAAKSTTREISEYECFMCKSRYPHESQLKKHIHTHMKHPFLCAICGAIFGTRGTLKHHVDLHHAYPDQSHKCTTCNKTFSTRHYMLKHNRRVHSKTVDEILCTICGSVLKSRDSFRRHMDLHNADPENPHKCDLCDKTFSTRRYMVNHMRCMHRAEREAKPRKELTKKCNECDKMFLTEFNLHQHMKVHAEGPIELTCTICNWKFNERKTLRIHMESHTDNTTTCKVCNKVLSVRYMKKHMKIHVDIRNEQCTICHNMFLDKQQLKQHMISHSGELKYKCTKDTCSKAYARSDKLLYHLRRSHPELLTLICRYSACRKGFLSVRSLKKHENDHYKEENCIGSTPQAKNELQDIPKVEREEFSF